MQVFFSWQSDIDKKIGVSFIRKALRVASNKFETNTNDNSVVLIDEATRNISGSKSISDSIFQKIKDADVFVADISSIHPQNLKGQIRITPNPNVLIELGFAINELGFERIVLLTNDSVTNFPKDIPFDIRSNRILRFTNLKSSKAEFNDLAVKLCAAFKAIHSLSPRIRKENDEYVKNQRDKEEIKRLLGPIDFDLLYDFTEELPNQYHMDIGNIHFLFNREYDRPGTFFYNKQLAELFENFHSFWLKLSGFPHAFQLRNVDDTYAKFESRNFGGDISKMVEDQKTIETLNRQFKSSIMKLIDYIHSKYLDIDVRNLNTEK